MAIIGQPYQLVAYAKYGKASHAPPEGLWERVGIVVRDQDAEPLKKIFSEGGPIEHTIPRFPGIAYEIKGTTGSEISPDMIYIRMPDGSIFVFNDPLEFPIQNMKSPFERQEV